MSIDKNKIKKILGISVVAIGVAFVGMSILARKKKPSSIYSDDNEQKNPFEGKKVVLVEDENDKENADGVKGHLEAIGDTEYNPSFYEKHVKRAIDVVLSFGGLVVLSPVFAVIALAIKIEDPGPVLFIQKRVGQNKRYFKLHKFRSMKMSTPHDVPTHQLENPEQYITKVGRFLRAHSLDELPQIWDIFVGNMSVIGPRPGLWNQDLLTAERDKYGANDVKPGLTGWAQINGRDELEIPDKAKLDGEYVKKMGLGMDIKCFLGSIHVIGKDESVVEGGTGEMKKEKKTIAVLSSHSPSLFWFRIDMMQDFISHDYQVYALGNEDENIWGKKFAERGIKYIQINVERNGINPLHDIKTFLSIRNTLKDIKPQKIFTYQAKTVIYGSLVAKSLGIKDVYPLIAGMGSIFLNDDFKTKLIRHAMIAGYKAALSGCPAVFFQNQDDVDVFMKNHILDKQEVVMLHGSGVDIERFNVQPLPEKTAFLCISRLIKDKGVYEYLEAAKKVKEKYPFVRCMLVGPYDSNPSAIKPEELQPFIDKGIEYFGEQEDVRPYLQQCSVYVLPSYREGTPKTVLEAMASGRAIITTDAPGCKETVKNNVNGILVAVKDIEGLFAAMESLVQKPETVVRMGIEGRKMAETIFDVNLVNKIICEAMEL